jgi:hypothetical protein
VEEVCMRGAAALLQGGCEHCARVGVPVQFSDHISMLLPATVRPWWARGTVHLHR